MSKKKKNIIQYSLVIQMRKNMMIKHEFIMRMHMMTAKTNFTIGSLMTTVTKMIQQGAKINMFQIKIRT
jgi:hypothetical protein